MDQDQQRDERIQTKLSGIPSKFKTLARRAMDGDVSPRQAIKAMCQECMGWEEAIARVKACGATLCPLWKYRPYQK